MTKIKTLGTAVLLIATVAAPVFAQDKGEPGSRRGLEPTSSAESERSRPDVGMRNSEKTGPGDFAVTDGLSGRGRTGDSIGQVAPGTSNSPAGNAAGE
jgi:hypothetical protein